MVPKFLGVEVQTYLGVDNGEPLGYFPGHFCPAR